MIFSAREKVSKLMGLAPERIVFTSGATAALNIAVFGSVKNLEKRGIRPRVCTTPFEHNSVLRPLFHLEKEGRIELFVLRPKEDGNLREKDLLSLLPDIFVFTLKSNVTGHRFFLRPALEKLKARGCILIGDGAQSVGCGVCTPKSEGVHILCASGHKGLLGIMGGGFMALSPECETLPEPLFFGGSGSESFDPDMPRLPPERFEAGTLPLPAIVSMGAGADFLLREGVERIEKREREAKKLLLEGLFQMPRYTVYEPWYPDGPVLVNHCALSPFEVEKSLSEKGVLVRSGFHCAPLAHRFLGTEKRGAVRLSVGPFTTKKEVVEALFHLSRL